MEVNYNQTIMLMKKLKLILALLAGLVVASATTVLADDAVTITGNMVCGKCTLQ